MGVPDWAANGEGQREHTEDVGQDSGAEQSEGDLQPDADAVQEEAQNGWLHCMNCAARAERGIPSTDRMGAVEGIMCCSSILRTLTSYLDEGTVLVRWQHYYLSARITRISRERE